MRTLEQIKDLTDEQIFDIVRGVGPKLDSEWRLAIGCLEARFGTYRAESKSLKHKCFELQQTIEGLHFTIKEITDDSRNENDRFAKAQGDTRRRDKLISELINVISLQESIKNESIR